MLVVNKIKTSNLIHFDKDEQLNIISFDTPLQQVLQQHLLLLRLLNQQNKWQLWISSRPMLKRCWIKQAGLHEQKVLQLANVNESNMTNVIEKALLTQTSSYVVACINAPLTDYQKQRLQMAVKKSGTHLFLVDDNYLNYNDFMTMSLAVNNIH